MIVHVYGPPRDEIDRLKAVILSRGWGIVQSHIERQVGEILEGSELLCGAPLIVLGVPTEEETREFDEALAALGGSGHVQRTDFPYKVGTD